MSSVVISGFYGFDNAGDEAILQSMVSELKKADSEIHIVVLSADPEKTRSEQGVHAVNRSNLFSVYHAIKHCDILISGGGSLLQDATSVLSMWYYSSVILMAYLLHKPVFAYAQGIGPVMNKFNIRLLKYIMNNASRVSVRDRRSQLELEKLGISRDVSCTIDPAFLLDIASREDSMKLLVKEAAGRSLDRPRIGFSIRRWKGDTDVSGIIAEVADRVDRELGAQVIIFPLHYIKDMELADEIAGKMRSKPIIIKDKYCSSDILGLYGLMDVNVCVRFHGLVFSIMNSIPTVAISYDPKIDSLMESMNAEDVLQYGNLSAEVLFASIRQRWESRGKTQELMDSKVQEFRQLAKSGIDEVIRLIRSI